MIFYSLNFYDNLPSFIFYSFLTFYFILFDVCSCGTGVH